MTEHSPKVVCVFEEATHEQVEAIQERKPAFGSPERLARPDFLENWRKSVALSARADYFTMVRASPATDHVAVPRELLERILIYIVEGDDAVQLKIGGVKIGAWGPSCKQAIVLLKLDAELRAILSSGRETK